MERTQKGITFLAGLVFGGLVGSSLTMLVAPRSGRETRTILRDEGVELRDRAETIASDARKMAEEWQTKTRKELDAQIHTLEKGLSEARSMVGDFRKELDRREKAMFK